MSLAVIDTVLPTKAESYRWFLHALFNQFQSDRESGKWCIFRSAETVDETWVAVRDAVVRGELAAAICSTPTQAAEHGGTYVICVFNRQARNIVEVMEVRQKLRELGIPEPLKYKRDLETFNNVYGTQDEFIYDESRPETLAGHE